MERNDGTRRTLECEEDVTVPAVADINADIQVADGETRSADQDIDSRRQARGNRSTRGAALFHRDREVADVGQAIAVTVTGPRNEITGVQRSVAVTVGLTTVHNLALIQDAVAVAVGGYRCSETGSQHCPVDQRTVVTTGRICDGHRPVAVTELTVEVRQSARSRRLHHSTHVVGRPVRNTTVVECRIDVGTAATGTIMEPDGASSWRGQIHHYVSRPGVGEIHIHIHVSQGQSTREGDGVDGRRQGVGNRCSRRTGSRITTDLRQKVTTIESSVTVTVGS